MSASRSVKRPSTALCSICFRHYRGRMSGYPANVPQFFAKFSAPRSDSAKMV